MEDKERIDETADNDQSAEIGAVAKKYKGFLGKGKTEEFMQEMR